MSAAKSMPVLQALPEVEIRRVFATSPERLFAAWTQPAQLARWWGRADGHTLLLSEGDPSRGGSYRIETLRPDGKQYRFWGEYRTVDAPNVAEYTWSAAFVEGGVVTQPMVTESLVRVEISPCPEGCSFVLKQSLLPGAPVCASISKGWEIQARAVEAYLANPAAEREALSVPEHGNFPATRDLLFEISIERSPAEVFRWLSEGELLTQWFPSLAQTEPRVGGKCSFEWLTTGKPNHYHFGEFTQYEPGRLLAYSWYPYQESPTGEALGPPRESCLTEVIWELTPSAAGTLLRLAHRGFGYGSEEQQKQFIGHGEGWTLYFNNLKSVLEHGVDLRPAQTT